MKRFRIQSIVLFQQLLLFVFLIQWPLHLPLFCYFLIFLFLLPAFSAVYIQRKQFKVSPSPREGAVLFTHGPYRYIRHPMYLSLLLAFLVVLIYSPHSLRFLSYALLLLVMLIKIHVEEKLLCRQFPGYRDYQGQTKRLIPFVY